MLGIIILIIGGITWMSYKRRAESEQHNEVVATIQIIIMAACVLFVLFAVGHYNPLGITGNNDCISAEQGGC